MSEQPIIRAEGSTSYWFRPDTVCVGARAAWDYFVAEEQAKPYDHRRIPAMLFYGRTDRHYWFMRFRNQETAKITPAEVKAATKRTKKLLSRAFIGTREFMIKADQATVADAREALFTVARLLEQNAEMQEERAAHPNDKRKNHFVNSPDPEFTRAQVSRLLHMAGQLG